MTDPKQTELVSPLRLAMRAEGDWWNAYAADPETMENATLLASIRLRFVQDPKARAAFLECMRGALTSLLADLGLPVAKWGGEVKAPEHERERPAGKGSMKQTREEYLSEYLAATFPGDQARLPTRTGDGYTYRGVTYRAEPCQCAGPYCPGWTLAVVPEAGQ